MAELTLADAIEIAVGPIGEVVEASISRFSAECARLHDSPGFGAFVRVGKLRDADPFEAPTGEDGAIYGLVYEVGTESKEPNRRAAAYGLDEESLRREQPQILQLLATCFSCLIIAHQDVSKLRRYLPARPPRVHAMVSQCLPEEVVAITERMDFLRAVVSAPDCAAGDEVIAAAIREGHRCRGLDEEYLVRAGKEVALLLRDDYDRLRAILRKLEP